MKMSIHTLNPVHLHRAAPLSGRKRAVNNLPAQSTPCRQRNRHPSEDHNFCLHSYFLTIKTDLKSLCSGAFNGTLGFAPIDQTKITIPPPNCTSAARAARLPNWCDWTRHLRDSWLRARHCARIGPAPTRLRAACDETCGFTQLLMRSQASVDNHCRTKVTCRRAGAKRGGSDAWWVCSG